MKSFRLTLVILFLLSAHVSVAQSNYVRGFRAGYIIGACSDPGQNCNVSIPEIKGKGKFRDGYSLGFEKGLAKRKDFDNKAYFREYVRLREEIASPNFATDNVDVLNKALEKVDAYYISGDYEKCISLGDQVARYLKNDYRLNMLKGLSLLELEDFKQGRNFLKWAIRDAEAPEAKEKITTIMEEVDNGTYLSNKMKYEAVITGSQAPDKLPKSSFAKNKKTAAQKAIAPVNKPVVSENKKTEPGDGKFRKGDYAGAIADYTAAINSGAGLIAYYKRALAKQELQDFYGASNDYKTILSGDQQAGFANIEDVYLNYASILIKQKKYTDAIPMLDNIVNKGKSSKMALALYHRGIAKINSGSKEGGCTDLSRSGELGNKEAYEEIKKSCQ